MTPNPTTIAAMLREYANVVANVGCNLWTVVAIEAQAAALEAQQPVVDFDQWYVENAFDYETAPLGSRDCGLQRKAWNAALTAALAYPAQQPVGGANTLADEWRRYAHAAVQGDAKQQIVAEVLTECAGELEALTAAQVPSGMVLVPREFLISCGPDLADSTMDGHLARYDQLRAMIAAAPGVGP